MMVLLAGCASSDGPPFEINNKQFHEKKMRKVIKFLLMLFQ
ncbi:hypothetical protein P20495_3906 [Pseudoalteromonas sp. BSi20495]|nr:hypothetical protein P20495_3906 [Pseudoalteromonas sp. BSi20495]